MVMVLGCSLFKLCGDCCAVRDNGDVLFCTFVFLSVTFTWPKHGRQRIGVSLLCSI